MSVPAGWLPPSNAYGWAGVARNTIPFLRERTPQQRRLTWLTKTPVVRALTRWSYNVFAKALYAWNRLHRRW
jgi:hypothetical protein